MLESLSPKPVFDYFEELTRIPRCSGSEQQVSDYLVEFAHQRRLEVIRDEARNVIIKKAGTAGYERSPAVIIQGHMDMVCEKSKGSAHDFSKDPIPLRIDGDFVRTTGTTLGADNGIAVAYGLALLDASDVPHPPIELLITTAEETGMNGAFALDPSPLAGKTLLNIDAENEGVMFVSCAGGVDLISEFDTQWEPAATGGLRIEVSGLKGGHSGLEIIRQRANAIKLLGRVLDAARKAGQFNIAAISGGTKSNAIAREAEAVITADASVLGEIEAIVERMATDLSAEFATADPDIRVVAMPADKVETQLDLASTERIVDFLVIAPNGVQSMSQDLENLVESSVNLGVLEQTDQVIKMTISARSSVNSIREDLACRLEALARSVNTTAARSAEYPAWQYEADSPIRDLCASVYKEVSGRDAKIEAIHAGLECGLLKQKLPDTDMISFGPNLYAVHTPDEHLSISSVASTWDFLTAVLARLK